MRVNKVEPFLFCLKTLQISQVYPRQSDKSNLFWFYFKSILVRFGYTFLLSIGCLWQFVKVIQDKIDADISQNVVVIISGIHFITFLGFFTYFSEDYEKLFKDILDFSFYGKPDNYEKVVKRTTKFSKYFYFYACCATTTWGAIRIYQASDCHKINLEQNVNLLCDTFAPVYFGFGHNKVIGKVIFIVQYFVSLLNIPPSTCVCSIMLELSEMIQCHCDHLNHMLRCIIEKRNRRDLKEWISYHIHILKLVKRISNLAQKSIGSFVILAAIITGCCEYELVKSNFLLGSAFLIGWLITVFVLCHAGQKLTNAVESVYENICNSDWYKLDIKSQKMLVVIQIKCQENMYLKGFPIGTFGYDLFVTILQTSYSYLTLLNNTRS